MPVETTSGFMAWIQQYGQIILFFAQIFFWLAVAVAALWSTMLFKRLVDGRTPSKDAEVVPAPAEKPAVNEFVE